MIVVEGPDGAGKSTLVDKISETLGIDVGERGVANRDKLYESTRQDTYTALSQAIDGTTPLKVWDRLFFSELVYADIVGRKPEFSAMEGALIPMVMTAIHCPVIFCIPPLDPVLFNVGQTKQMPGVRENVGKIYERYVELINRVEHDYKLNLTLFDYTGDRGADSGGLFLTEEEILARCEEYYTQRMERMW